MLPHCVLIYFGDIKRDKRWTTRKDALPHCLVTEKTLQLIAEKLQTFHTLWTVVAWS